MIFFPVATARTSADPGLCAGRSRAGSGGWALIRGIVASLALLYLGLAPAAAEEDVETLRIVYFTQEVERPSVIYGLDEPPQDEGLQGGRLAIADNNTTGQFTNQKFEFFEVVVPVDGDMVAAFRELVGQGYRHVITNLPTDKLLKLADLPEAQGVLIYNAGASDDTLRNADCRPNVLHILPSRAMLADALAQYLIWKKWRKWFLVVGRRDEDRLFAAAVRRAAGRFGGKIVAEKVWEYGPDARRTAQAEMPVFTQGIDYDVLIVADEIGEFGEYLIYRTWEPRLVAGTQGLVPTMWHRTHEQWGGWQLQRRFHKLVGRWMTPLDHAVWAAVRVIGEAATRAQSTAFDKVAAYLRGPEFALAAFKGVALSFRPWNGQLRQPVLLAAPRTLVSVSPQRGFLHQYTELDTLGYDRPESGCELD